MGWSGVFNGELLTLAVEQFDVFLTVDRNLAFQRNLTEFDIAVVVLHAATNRLQDLMPLVAELVELLPEVSAGTVAFVRT
jgi:hypothetical protein